jgi:predicted aconitase with swiveling domain
MRNRTAEKFVLHGRGIVGGVVEGEALASKGRIAGSIGFRPDGTIYSKRQPGEDVDSKSFRGKVFVFKSSIGSSGYSSDFFDAWKKGNGPLAMLVPRTTTYVVQSAIETNTPTVVDFDKDPCDVINTGDWVKVDADKGIVEVQKK